MSPTSSDSQPLMEAVTAGEPTTPTNSDNRVPVAANYDHCRVKHDRVMNSSVDVAAINGLRSSKILGYYSRAKKKLCLRDSGSQWNYAPEYECLRNWNESSKAIAPDIVVNMAKSLQHEGIKL